MSINLLTEYFSEVSGVRNVKVRSCFLVQATVKNTEDRNRLRQKEEEFIAKYPHILFDLNIETLE